MGKHFIKYHPDAKETSSSPNWRWVTTCHSGFVRQCWQALCFCLICCLTWSHPPCHPSWATPEPAWLRPSSCHLRLRKERKLRRDNLWHLGCPPRVLKVIPISLPTPFYFYPIKSVRCLLLPGPLTQLPETQGRALKGHLVKFKFSPGPQHQIRQVPLYAVNRPKRVIAMHSVLRKWMLAKLSSGRSLQD